MIKLLNILIAIELFITILLLSYFIYNIQIKETVWLIPNDASCGDIWTDEDMKAASEKFELKLID